MLPFQRALLSVTDKTGIVELAQRLTELGVEIYSTGGTSTALRQAEITVHEVSDLTGFPEILDGRVKTLHPKIFGALLGQPEKAEHAKAMKDHGITPIGLVVVNLYPFEKISEGPRLEDPELVEYIDIGGVSLLRAAAKNFERVLPVCDPEDYGTVLEELQSPLGLSTETRRRLVAKVFAHTAHYDAVIAATLKSRWNTGPAFPNEVAIALRKVTDLRYGENPHQKAALYRESGGPAWGVVSAKVLQGKETSFNNYLDCEGAWQICASFTEPACAIIKHTTPCGVAVALTSAEAFVKAYQADPLSAFGGIVAFNRAVDRDTAKEMQALFVECVIAPGYHPEAREIFKAKKNLRLLEQPNMLTAPFEQDFRHISGGFLVQEPDRPSSPELKVVTSRAPSEQEKMSLDFAWKVVKYVKSNSLVLVRGLQTVGIGSGQMSRVDGLRVALMKMSQTAIPPALQKLPLVLASDGFFPFRDNVDEAARAGVTAIVQPGGSVRDQESIDACNGYGVSMVFTGVRHFRH